MTPESTQAMEDQVMLYAAGSMPAEEHEEFELRLQKGWPEAEALLHGLEPVLEELNCQISPVVPPQGLKEKLMWRIKGSSNSLHFRFSHEGEFQKTKHPGIAVRMLHLDAARQSFTCLMRLEAGARYPHHHHDGIEECLVLEGSILVGGVRLKAGDYQRAEAESDHAEQWSDEGALLYLTAPLSLLMK